jgi:hypothetical protein
LEFKLTDTYGNTLELHGGHVSFTLLFVYVYFFYRNLYYKTFMSEVAEEQPARNDTPEVTATITEPPPTEAPQEAPAAEEKPKPRRYVKKNCFLQLQLPRSHRHQHHHHHPRIHHHQLK